MERLLIIDKQTCDHEYSIPGLEASLCKKCVRWVVTNPDLCHQIRIARARAAERARKKKRN